jgi:hypothetical protein
MKQITLRSYDVLYGLTFEFLSFCWAAFSMRDLLVRSGWCFDILLLLTRWTTLTVSPSISALWTTYLATRSYPVNLTFVMTFQDFGHDLTCENCTCPSRLFDAWASTMGKLGGSSNPTKSFEETQSTNTLFLRRGRRIFYDFPNDRTTEQRSNRTTYGRLHLPCLILSPA